MALRHVVLPGNVDGHGMYLVSEFQHRPLSDVLVERAQAIQNHMFGEYALIARQRDAPGPCYRVVSV